MLTLADQILSNLVLDLPPTGYAPRNTDLIACLLTSRTLHSCTLSILYRNITIPHSTIFSKMLRHLKQYPALGTIVRRLDFSHFTSVGLGRTRQMNTEIQNLTADSLLECLSMLPLLNEFLAQESVDENLSGAVLTKLLCNLPSLKAVDFCGCSSTDFADSLDNLVTAPGLLPPTINIRRLGLHECYTVSADAFHFLLPRLKDLTHLDVSRTQVTDAALARIPADARLTHLNLGRCTRVTGRGIVEFLTIHPAVKDSLVYLNLMSDISRYRLLGEGDVAKLLPSLPSTLRSLNLNGAKLHESHFDLIRPLTKHLEELALAHAPFSMRQINSLFVPSVNTTTTIVATPEEQSWIPHTLRYIDLTGIPSITQATLYSNSCAICWETSRPLEVVELGEDVIRPLKSRETSNKKMGWTVRELGRRGWYVRLPKADGTGNIDDGGRWWKMGAHWWGMRKLPVARGDVGGLYGHYMFKR